jgi:hypothetical protein
MIFLLKQGNSDGMNDSIRYSAKRAPLRFLFAVFLIGSACSARAGVAEIWRRAYGGPSGAKDYANAVAIGSDGNVYVTGCSQVTNVGDYVTVAYSRNGTALWTNIYDQVNDCALSIGVYGSNRVYVTGYKTGDIYSEDCPTVAYSSGGVPLWTNHVNGKGSGLAVGKDGTVYVTGTYYDFWSGTGSGDNFFTAASSSNGTQLWINYYNGGGNALDVPVAVTVDAASRVYVTGTSYTITNAEDYATVAYASNGVPLWTNRYDGPARSNDLATALATDASGNVFVTGQSRNASRTYDYATVGYSSAGVPLWTNRYDNGSDDIARAIATGSGNIYVTGSSGGGASTDFATVAYSSSGALLWTRRYNGPGNPYDAAYAVVVDSGGNVYVGGTSGTNSVVIAYTSAGLALWTNVITSFTANTPYALACGPRGALAVGGSFVTPSSGKDTAYDLGLVQLIASPVMQFSSIHLVPNLGCQLTVSCPTNVAFRLEASSNLVDWLNITSYAGLPVSSVDYTDSASSNFSTRFYRASWVP